MRTLTFDELLRSLKQNMDSPHSFLLGAGASIESGIQSASDCIWDWKREIFLSQNPTMIETCSNTKLDFVQHAIQKWLDEQRIFPALNDDKEYSFYAERALPIEDDRTKYFQHLAEAKKPSIGYHLICMLAELGWIKSVWTTNFDGLMTKCAHTYDISPIEITTDTADRIYRSDNARELLCVGLHGDYKYGFLKNTVTELDSQNDTFSSALSYELAKRSLIVIGYSGRDKSLMAALAKAYETKGHGRLYWCCYGQNANLEVTKLIDKINENGRTAFYVPTNGFDSTLYSIARHCKGEDQAFLSKVDTLKKSLGANIQTRKTIFTKPNLLINKIVQTNAFPISFPKMCYQFQIKYPDGIKPWDFCKSLAKHNIMAVPHKGCVYAWGSYDQIQMVCGSKLIGKISQTPFTREAVSKIGAFQELLRKTVIAILGQRSLLDFSTKWIWDCKKSFNRTIGSKMIKAFCGIEVSLFFDHQFSYITLSPTIVYDENQELTRDERKEISNLFYDWVNNNKPNLQVNKYTLEWVSRLLGTNGIKTTFPLSSSSGYEFALRANSAILGVNYGSPYPIKLPAAIPENRIVFRGIEYNDPPLEFYNPQTKKRVEDFHPMRGINNNAPIDYEINANVLRSFISLGVICPQGKANMFQHFLSQLQNRQSVGYNTEFVIPFPGFTNAYKTGLNIPNPRSTMWLDVGVLKETDISKAAIELGNAITKKLDQLSALQADVAVVFIPSEYEPITSFSTEYEKFDLHNYVKAYAAQKNIATQFIREKTLVDGKMYCQIMWALSLAIYVKSCRIPWTISGIQNGTAFAGIGYSINPSPNGSDIVVGCSHIYSADGQGMKYKLARINDCTFDRKKNPYLTENEAYRLGISIKELFYRSFSELPKRVVIHKRTPFREDEINGLVSSLSSAGIADIELLEITYEDNIKCFAYDKNSTEIDGFPVRRGLCFPLNENTIHLFTHGIAPSVVGQYRKYIQGGKALPVPLRIVKHYGKGSMEQIATEILGLSKMNWNSFGLYSKLPCTIESSHEIAKIGWLLSQYEGAVYDYRYFM